MDPNNRRDRAHAEAAEWLLRLEQGPLSPDQSEEFADWLRESALHVSEMLQIGRLHAMLAEYPDWDLVTTVGAEEPEDAVVPFTRRVTDSFPTPGNAASTSPNWAARSNRRLWLGAALAAVVGMTLWLSVPSRTDVIQTGRGERRGVTLADGSFIQIDPQTRLRIRFETQLRDVQLEEGRALFRVAKDPSRPFLVRAGATVVRAVGTQFGVDWAQEGIVVTVASGKVAVFPERSARALVEPAASLDAARRSGLGGRTPSGDSGDSRNGPRLPELPASRHADAVVYLTAGQQMTVARSGASDPIRQVDSASALAWAEGRLVFENAAVSNVVEQFNRYNVVQLHVGDVQLASQSVHGVFDASEPESFISALQTVTSVRVEKHGLDITLFSSP